MIKCVQCGRAGLEAKTVQLQGTIRGEDYTVEMQGLECPRCGYKTIEGSAMPEYGRLLADQYRARHGLLTSEDIRARRNRLSMTQQRFAEYLPAGVASVKRWEMGKIQDQRSDQLIKERTAPQVKSVHACAVSFHSIHCSTSQYLWPKTGLVAFAVLAPGPHSSGDIQQYIENVMRGPGQCWNEIRQTGTSSRLQVQVLSPRQTLSPHLAWLFTER